MSSGKGRDYSVQDKSQSHSNSDKNLQEIFNNMDKDGDGRITRDELRQVFGSLGRQISQEEADLMINTVDLDKNGSVEYDEFVHMMKRYDHPTVDKETELRETFKVFDHNGDNLIDCDEIKSTMGTLGIFLSDAEVASMVKAADTNNDGKIDFSEFKTLFANLQGQGK